MKTNRKLQISLLAAASLMAIATPAFGQSAASPEAPVASANEIIVTAQRRAERLEDVPVSITAVQGDVLSKAGVVRMQDLGQVVAGAQIGRGGALVQPSIRGVTSLTSGWTYENGVALYVDGFYSPDTVSLGVDLANIASVSVLKGPQGTLYGRNAMGGAIVIETLAPSDTPTASAKFSYGRFNDIRAEGYVSAPLAEGVSFSVAGYHRVTDGYIRDIGANPSSKADDFNAAPIDQSTIRTKLQIKPSSNLEVTLAYNYLYLDDPRGLIFQTFRYSPPSPYPQPPFKATAPNTSSLNGITQNAVVVETYTGTVKLDTGIGTLTSYTGWNKRRNQLKYDFDGTKAQYSYSVNPYERNTGKTFQQTLDLAINAIDRVDLVVGGFYFNDKILTGSDNYSGMTAAGDPILQKKSTSNLNAEAFALYADATVRLTDQLFLSGGLRYSDEKRFVSYFETAGAVTTLNPPLAGKTANFDALTPRASIRYEISPRTNVYASYSQGFRSGVFNPGAQPNPALVIPIKPERITAYEVGFKTASSTFRFDASAYYYDYKDLQVAITAPNPLIPGAVLTLVSNAKRADGYGGEMQATFTPLEGLNLRAGAAYIHSQYKDFKNAIGTGWNAATGLNVTNQTQDWSGQQMARAPKWSGNAGFDYTFGLGGGKVTVASNLSLTSSYVIRDPSLWGPLAGAALANKQRYRQSGYAIANAQVNWTDPSDHLTIGVYCDNCTNTQYQIFLAGGAFGDYHVHNEPVNYGARIGMKF